MDALTLREQLRDEARRIGFAASGVAGVSPFGEARAHGLTAIAEGRMAGMGWYSQSRVEAAADLTARHPWGRSLLALAWPYAPASGASTAAASPATSGGPRGRFAAYACLPGSDDDPSAPSAVDYHDRLGDACDALIGWLRAREPTLQAKRYVDHGWAFDRAVAERAGVGFCGKNACLITPEAGSYVLLCEILLSVDLPATEPSRRNCGSCSACIPACPTGAIVEPGVIDARRCISYLTIEHRGAIAEELRQLIGTWAFGCDLCQEACPINARLAPVTGTARATTTSASTARGPVPFPDLVECLELDDTAFAARFRRTAVWRTGRAGLARNAAIALGNAGDAAAVPALRRARAADPDPVVREAAAWAEHRLTPPAR